MVSLELPSMFIVSIVKHFFEKSLIHTTGRSRHHVLAFSSKFRRVSGISSKCQQDDPVRLSLQGLLTLLVSFLVVIGVVPGGGIWRGQLLNRRSSSRRKWDPASV